MNLTMWGVNEWVAVVSATLALASFLFNWGLVRRQAAMQFESLKAQMDADMMHWAHEAIDAVSDAIALARSGGVYEPADLRRRLLETSQRLSSLADRGRLYFPNVQPEASGQEREAAFRGFRPTILDSVVFAHYQVDQLNPDLREPDHDAAAFLTKCRRLLVSEVQNAIDPRRRSAMLRQLATGKTSHAAESIRSASELGEDLRARYPDIGVGARGEDWIAQRTERVRRGRA